MDALSQLLSLSRMSVQMDAHCLLAGKYAVAHETSAPGEAPFHLVLAGKCRVRSVTGWTDLNAGDFLLLPHGDAHDVLPPRSVQSKTSRPVHRLRLSQDSTLPIKGNVRSPSNADLDLLCGRFICAYGAGSMLLRALPPRVHVNLQDMASGELLGSLIALLQREATLAQAGALAVVNALGQAILTFALRHHGVDGSAPPGLLTIMADRRLGSSVSAVLQDSSRDWTIASLGEKVSMSRATYARQFRAKAGMGVSEFLLTVRMMRACDLIQHTDRGLAEIGQAVGYASEAAFGKAFQKIVGETPGRWRRKQKSV